MNGRRRIQKLFGLLPTGIAILWIALFPFWLFGESNPLGAVASGELSIASWLSSLSAQSYSNITRAKWDGMLILTLVTLVGAILYFLFAPKDSKPHHLSHLPLVLLCAYCATLALSARFGSWSHTLNTRSLPVVWWGSIRYEGLISLLCYALIFLLMRWQCVRIRWVLHAASISLMVYLTLVLLQYAGMNPLQLFPVGRSIQTNYEFQGTIGNIDMVSSWVCLLMPGLLSSFLLFGKRSSLHLLGGLCAIVLTVCMEVQSGMIVLALTLLALSCLALRRPQLRARQLYLLALALLLLALRKAVLFPWLDGSSDITWHVGRTSLLLLLCSMVCLAFGAFLHRHPLPAMSRKCLTILLVLLLLCGLLMLWCLSFPQGSALWEAQELLHGRAQDAFGSERVGVWRITLEMAADSPWFGTGPDTFYYAFNDYLRQTGQYIQQHFDNPHNFFLQTMSNSGIPAMLLLMALCLASLWCARKRKHGLLPALMALGFLVQGMFTFSICLTSPMFYCVLGLCAGAEAPTAPFRQTTKEVSLS